MNKVKSLRFGFNIFLGTAICALLWIKAAFGITLLLKEEALGRIFPEAEQISEKSFIVSDEKIESIKRTLGGSLAHLKKDRDVMRLNQQREFVFYFAEKKNKLTGVAIIIDEPGKWGPVKFIVRLSPEGIIEAIAVMEYKETRGRPIARQSFLRQFIGKNINGPIALHNDIKGISGATVSSNTACCVAEKAVILYKELVLGN